MEKARLEPRMVRFKPVVLMSRLRMRLRMDELQKGKIVHLQ